MSWQAVVLIIFAAAVVGAANGQQPLTPDADNKCGGCPCNSPCTVPPPPPPPSPPPPPPPSPKPPTPVPGQNCPPPPYYPKTPSGPSQPTYPNYPTPPSQYVYFTGPPGSLYPIDQTYNCATTTTARSFAVGLQLLISSYILLALIS